MSDSDVPSASECQRRIDALVAVSGCDEAEAQMRLQDQDWDLQKAVDAFLNTQNETKEDEPTFQTRAPEQLLYLTWNIDGLAEKNLQIRTKAVAKIIQTRRADIVCLQELVPESYQYLKTKLPEYQFVCDDPTADYFVAVLLRRFVVYLDSFQTVPYPRTRMGRNLLTVECHVGSARLTVMTTHLESTKQHADERMAQLKTCFDRVQKEPADRTVLLGGDMNLRDQEVSDIGGVPGGVEDVWLRMGADKETKYTWDMMRNTNLEVGGRFKPRCRFDRVYIKDSVPLKAKVEYFGLVGIERIRSAQTFPSDHWGIACGMKIKSNDD